MPATDPHPAAALLAELWRGDRVESRHFGHAVIADANGTLRAVWGDPDRMTYPRSAIKIMQALPLVESGAAARAGLKPEHLALACASHQGAAAHTDLAKGWLSTLGLGTDALRCGPQIPADRPARVALRAAHSHPGQEHNNCSGKHCGFLTLARDLGAGPEYVDPAHPVQVHVRTAMEELIGEDSPGYGLDGCSAPNFAFTLAGIARGMARLADPSGLGRARGEAAGQLVAAMAAHPHLIAGEGAACTDLTRALGKGSMVKTGAEGVYVAVLPDLGLGIALKVEDGATRASEAATAALLVRLGALDREHPAVQRRIMAEDRNRRDILTGHLRAAEGLFA